MKNSGYLKLTATLIGAWFVLALSASAFQLIKTTPGAPPIGLGLAVILPLSAFFIAYVASPGFRQFLLDLSPRALTLLHSWRVAGFTFVVLYSAGMLPGAFALPAGLGDIAIGLTAPFVALNFAFPGRRKAFITWQFLGILDLVTAIGSGVTASLLSPHGVATDRMTMLPMSLIPTFAVPFFLMLHFVCIAQAVRWNERSSSSIRESLPHPA